MILRKRKIRNFFLNNERIELFLDPLNLLQGGRELKSIIRRVLYWLLIVGSDCLFLRIAQGIVIDGFFYPSIVRRTDSSLGKIDGKIARRFFQNRTSLTRAELKFRESCVKWNGFPNSEGGARENVFFFFFFFFERVYSHFCNRSRVLLIISFDV